LHSLADAGAELWLMLFNEWPVNAPDLPCLNDAKTFAPRIEAVGSHRVMHWRGQIARHRVDRRAQQVGYLRIGLCERVIANDKFSKSIRGVSRVGRRLADAAKTPEPLANQPAASKDGAIAMAPVMSMRPWDGRMP